MSDEELKSYPAAVYPSESAFEKDLGHLLNKHSAENESGTPDFILAMFLTAQLELFNQTIKNRASWRGESVELPALQRLHAESDQIAIAEPKDEPIQETKPTNRFERYQKNGLST